MVMSNQLDTAHVHHDTDATDVMGFWIYIMSDCILFAAIFAVYAVLHTATYGGCCSLMPCFVVDWYGQIRAKAIHRCRQSNERRRNRRSSPLAMQSNASCAKPRKANEAIRCWSIPKQSSRPRERSSCVVRARL